MEHTQRFQDTVLARATLLALVAATSTKSAPELLYQLPGSREVNFETAVSRLTHFAKPLYCSAELKQQTPTEVIAIEVRAMTTPDDSVLLRVLEEKLLPLELEYVRERSGKGRAPVLALRAGGEYLVLSEADYVQWRRYYDLDAPVALEAPDSEAVRLGASAMITVGKRSESFHPPGLVGP